MLGSHWSPLVNLPLTYNLGIMFCSLVKFLTPASGLQGYWDPYPIDMEFRPPCMVLSTIGISKPGKLEGQSAKQCATHLHQLHVCLPSSKQKTRLLYRMSLDFAPILKHVPFMQYLWRHFAEKVQCFLSIVIICPQNRFKPSYSAHSSEKFQVYRVGDIQV